MKPNLEIILIHLFEYGFVYSRSDYQFNCYGRRNIPCSASLVFVIEKVLIL